MGSLSQTIQEVCMCGVCSYNLLGGTKRGCAKKMLKLSTPGNRLRRQLLGNVSLASCNT